MAVLVAVRLYVWETSDRWLVQLDSYAELYWNCTESGGCSISTVTTVAARPGAAAVLTLPPLETYAADRRGVPAVVYPLSWWAI